MSSAGDIKKTLEEKSTSELQESIVNTCLTEEASAIARTILNGRGASIPEAISEDVLEEDYKRARSTSNRSFLLTIIVICIWAGYAYITGEFEPGQEKRLNRGMLVAFVSVAAIWGWDVFGRRK